MNKELIIDVKSDEIVIALLEEKQLVELYRDKPNAKFSVGDIYLAKVKKTIPGLNAAFVDIGYEKDAFLHYLDLGPQFKTLKSYLDASLSQKQKNVKPKHESLPDIEKKGKITDVINAGDIIMVQIAKEPISQKGPRLSSEISIAGRNIVMIPFSDKVTISQKIRTSEEKSRLRKLITSIKPKDFGVIVRTAADGKRVSTLDEEMRTLLKKWDSAFENLKEINPPQKIIGEINKTSLVLRDLLNSSFNNIFVNNDETYRELREYIGTISPENVKIVKIYNGSTPIFEQFGVEKQIKTLFGKTVTFKSGAYLIVEHTEALHVIDVNSGNRSKKESDQETNALQVNLAAIDEICRQIRLRDMGGIIVVDFIDMQNPEHKQKVYELMKEKMKSDTTRHTILPLSKFGIMEITRQRVRPETQLQVVEKCPTCKGSGEVTSSGIVIDEIENNINYIISNKLHYKKLVIKSHPFISCFLNSGFFSLKYKWMLKYKCRITVLPVKTFALLEYHIVDINDDEFEI